MSDLAFEAAAAHFEHALGSLELVDDAADSARCDLLVRRAEALHLAGDERRYGAVFEAAKAARAIDDADRLARAALVLVSTSTGSTRAVTSTTSSLPCSKRPSPRFPPMARRCARRLLSSLAVELQWGDDGERRMALAQEALAVARATGNPVALSHVLPRSWALLDVTGPWHIEFGRLNAEAEAAALETGDQRVLLEVHNYATWTAAMLGDRAEMQRRFDAYARISDQIRQPAATAMRIFREAAVAEYDGRLDDAERLTLEAAELATAADVPEDVIRAFVGGIFYNIRLAQGRSDELVGTIEDLVASAPGAPVWRVALAGALVECDRVNDAREHYMWLAADDCSNVPHDVEYPVTIDGLARMSYRMQPPEAVVKSIHERLLPFTGFMNWSGTGISGPNDQGLAMTSATLGRHDDADSYFAATLELCERGAARVWIARAQFDWARVLAGRGDAQRAREHAEAAMAIGEELGMTGPFSVVTRGRALLASL